MRMIGMWCVVLAAAGVGCGPSDGGTGGGDIAYYRLLAPGGVHDIEQASGLHYGRLGDREGLWLVCDRNGGRSAGRLYFVSVAALERATQGGAVAADEVFRIVPPQGGWSAFAAAHGAAGDWSISRPVGAAIGIQLVPKTGPVALLSAP